MLLRQAALATIFITLTVNFSACTKDQQGSTSQQLDTSLLSKYNWLETPKADTNIYCAFHGAFYSDTLIRIDTLRYSFNSGSSYGEDYIVIQDIRTGTVQTPCTMPSGTPMPTVSQFISGSYQVNIADSVITKFQTNQPSTIPPFKQKILLLTQDSLKVFQDTIPYFHLSPVTHSFHAVIK